jgi:hypothetical protein
LRNKVFEQYCAPKLQNEILPRVRKQLQGMPNLLAEYDDSKIGRMLSLKPQQANLNFESLIFTETQLVAEIHKAGQRLRKHLDAQKDEEAIKHLAEFGASLTSAFNKKAGATIYAGDKVRPLGALLFIEVAKVFDGDLVNELKPAAMLELFVLQKQSEFALEDYLKDKRPPASEIALQQRILNVGAPSL